MPLAEQTVRFLRYLSDQYPHIGRLEQLQRHPHLLNWLTGLRLHIPPLSNSTHAQLVIRLRRLFEELAWTQQLPALAHLLISDDVPRTHHYLPRPLTPEQDHLIQGELLVTICTALPCCCNAIPACASANVPIWPSIASAPSAQTNGLSSYHSASSRRNAGSPRIPSGTNSLHVYKRCVPTMRLLR